MSRLAPRKQRGFLFPANLGRFAAALAFARVFGFAAHVSRLTAALALAAIQTFAVMFGGGGVGGACVCPLGAFAARRGHGSGD